MEVMDPGFGRSLSEAQSRVVMAKWQSSALGLEPFQVIE
jgi:hypothetical protein